MWDDSLTFEVRHDLKCEHGLSPLVQSGEFSQLLSKISLLW